MTNSMNELSEKMREALTAGVGEESLAAVKKKLQDIFYEIETDIDYRLKDDLAPNLVAFVVDMAERSVKAILDGNEDEFRRYIGCERHAYTGRSESFFAHNKKDEAGWHPIIHGTLFEQGHMALRRKLVDAHRDLITSQRILDLEDQLTSVVAQHNKMKAEVERLREERRYA